MQEPFSVICSIGNLWAHYAGLQKVLTQIPEGYSMRPFYIWLARFNMTAWVFSSIFHTRDFRLTEELDYLAAGAAVLYGMYYTPVRVFRLDLKTPRRRSILRIWTFICAMLYMMHVGYLKGIRWDYTYNMGANVAAGVIQNLLWSGFSINKYLTSRRLWATWPGIVVAWITFAMSMELFDFPPWMLSIDAHSLWHFFTIFPTIIWYKYAYSIHPVRLDTQANVLQLLNQGRNRRSFEDGKIKSMIRSCGSPKARVALQNKHK